MNSGPEESKVKTLKVSSEYHDTLMIISSTWPRWSSKFEAIESNCSMVFLYVCKRSIQILNDSNWELINQMPSEDQTPQVFGLLYS